MSEQTEPTPAPSRTGQAGATAHDAGVATSSKPPAGDAPRMSVAAGDVPSAELCWLEFNTNTSSWEVWTSRDARRLFLFSSGRDHAQALVDLDIYEEAERELRQANQP
jgi:hypothetical protein